MRCAAVVFVVRRRPDLLGDGVPQDYAEGLKWVRLAAGQGNARAQYVLGAMYDSGRGIPQPSEGQAAAEAEAGEEGQGD